MINQEDILYGRICIAGMPIGSVIPAYEGPYEVTPRIVAQSLPTENKQMTNNLTIKAITYAEVSNISGKTAVIGEI